MRRIYGHVHAITKMLDEGRSYPEIVQQISAVRAALDSVADVIVSDLVDDCVAKSRSKESFEDSLLELQAVVASGR